VISDDQKIKLIAQHFKNIMYILGLDLKDDSLKGSLKGNPHRLLKMYVKEIFSGLNPKTKPEVTLFENKYHTMK
jgi:GTP cyclohydrolase I